ncbi:MAG: DUF86 domain-containing protein [Polyangia bacterium]
MSRDSTLFLEDMLSACRKVREYVKGMSREEFLESSLVYDAVVRNLEILGEAAKHVPDEIKSALFEIEWRKIAGLRDFLAHAYFGIDDDILWDVVDNKVPELERILAFGFPK